MKPQLTNKAFFQVQVILTFFIIPALFAAPLYWDPAGSQTTDRGGAGVWDTTTPAWWTGNAAHIWSAEDFLTYDELVFGGSGQSAPYGLILSEAGFTAPQDAARYEVKLRFEGDYNIASSNAAGTTISAIGGNPHIAMSVIGGKAVTFDGLANPIKIIGESDNPDLDASSLKFFGGGSFVLKNNVLIQNTHAWGLISIGDVNDSTRTSITLSDAGTSILASRLFVDNAIVNVDGGLIKIVGNTTNNAAKSSALQIGGRSKTKNTASTAFNINSGTVIALGMGGNNIRGIMFRDAEDGSGGTLRLNGGLLVTTNIDGKAWFADRSTFIFNGGTLAASGTMYNATQADWFLTSFVNTATSGVWIEAGGAFVDTNDVIVNSGRVRIRTEMGGSGNFTKLGGNILAFQVANTYTGTTIVAGGTLQLVVANGITQSQGVRLENGTVLNSTNLAQSFYNLEGAGTVLMGTGKLTIDSTKDTIFSGTITGSGNLEKKGAAKLTLTGAKGFTGAITVSAGALQGNTSSLVGDIANSGTLIFDQAADGVYESVINGTGALGKSGAGKLTLAAAQNYSGGVSIAAGALQGNTQSILGDVANSGTLIFEQATDGTYTGIISGAGVLEKSGTGKLTLGSAQSYTGDVVIKAGILQGDSNSLRGNIANSGTLIFDQAAAGIFSGQISGAGALVKAGSDVLTLTTASAHNGVTSILQGTLKLDAVDALASSSRVSIAATASLRSTNLNQTLRNLEGDGAIEMGSGSLILDVTTGKVTTYGGLITMSGGSLTKTGQGKMTLAGANIFPGDIMVNQGSLLLGNAAAQYTGNITLSDGVTFGGVGAVSVSGKTVTMGAGTVIQIGIDGSLAPQTLTFNGNLSITGSSVIDVDLFTNNESDQLKVLGTFTVSGTNRINIGAFTSGTFNIGNIGELYENGTNPYITIRGQSVTAASRQGVDASTDGTGNLWLVTKSDISRASTWTGSNGVLWDANSDNWKNSGSIGLFASGDRVVFDSVSDAGHEANRSIIIEGFNVTISDMYVSGSGNYSFGGASITTDKDSVVNGNGAITGATGKLYKEGTGTLTLQNTGTNNFKGGMEIKGGRVVLASAGAVGMSAVAITGNNVVFEIGAEGVALGGTVDLGAFGVTYADGGYDSSIDGAISGGGGIRKTGTGVLTLGASSSYTGATVISEGVIKTTATLAFAQSSSVTVASGATLDLNGHSQIARNLAGAGHVALGSEALSAFVVLNESMSEFSGTISGAGSLVKTGTGMFVLSGTSSHTGATAILEGTLRANTTDAFMHSGTMHVEDGAALDFNNKNQSLNNISGGGTIIMGSATMSAATHEDTVFSGRITGAGAVVLSGTGALTLEAESDYAGGTWISADRVVARAVNALGSGTIHLGTASTLEFNGASGELANPVIGGGMLDVKGGGQIRLTRANVLQRMNISGAVTVVAAAHTAALSGANNAAVNVTDGATLQVATSGLIGGNVTISGGTLLFGTDENGRPFENFNVTSLKFSNLAQIAFTGPLVTGEYTLVNGAITGVLGVDYIYDASQYGMQILIANNKMIAYHRTIDPSKDIAFAFDGMIAVTSAVYSRMSEGFLLPLVERSPKDKEHNFWLKAIGSFADYETNEMQAGHTDKSYGALMGYDVISRNRRWLGGFYAGATKNTIDSVTEASVEGDQEFAGVYGSMRIGSAYLGIDAGGGWIRSKTARREGTGEALGTYGIDYMSVSAEFGFVLPLWDGGAIRPAAALHYMDLQFKDYMEHGPGAVMITDFSQNVLQSLVSLQAYQSFKMPWGWESMIDAMIGWRQTVKGNGSHVVGSLATDAYTTFDLTTDGYVRGSTVIGMGLRTNIGRNTIWGLGYDLEVTTGRMRHTVNTSLRWLW